LERETVRSLKLRKHGGGMWMAKRISRRRSDTRVGTKIRAHGTW
jgi:hypothetical protein